MRGRNNPGGMYYTFPPNRLQPNFPATQGAGALFAAMTTPPTEARKVLINNLILSLKSAGVWDSLDLFYVLAAETEQAARLNWKAPSLYTAVATASPTFTADRGFTGNGSSSYLAVPFNLATNGVNYVRDSGSLSVWCRTAAPNTAGNFGTIAGATASISARGASTQFGARVNQTARSDMGAQASAVGWWSITRASAAGIEAFKNGASFATATIASEAVASDTLGIGRVLTTYSDGQFAAAALGAHLDATKQAAFYTALQTYMTAVGA